MLDAAVFLLRVTVRRNFPFSLGQNLVSVAQTGTNLGCSTKAGGDSESLVGLVGATLIAGIEVGAAELEEVGADVEAIISK